MNLKHHLAIPENESSGGYPSQSELERPELSAPFYIGS
jgi:hypothetical protein